MYTIYAMTSASTTKSSSGLVIVAALRDAIMMGRWAPGTALRQSDLATEFGVSRIPVREALQTLQSEGLIRIEPNRGAYVASLTAFELTEIFDLRVLLETDMLRRAVPHHTERTMRKLAAIQRELDDADEPTEWVRLDRAFHDTLYRPSARCRTAQLVAELRASVERFSLAHLGPEVRRVPWNDEHQQLMKAVQEQRTDDACAMLAIHLRQTQRVALTALALLAPSDLPTGT